MYMTHKKKLDEKVKKQEWAVYNRVTRTMQSCTALRMVSLKEKGKKEERPMAS